MFNGELVFCIFFCFRARLYATDLGRIFGPPAGAGGGGAKIVLPDESPPDFYYYYDNNFLRSWRRVAVRAGDIIITRVRD